MSTPFSFELLNTDGAARRGRIHTAHGTVETPAFMPVGTAATVKAMTPESVRSTGAEIILGNTYHLMIRPTAQRIHNLGGLHQFMNWEGPILTDSGGYQVMSLADLRKLTEEGVTFRSHIDGSKHRLTPEDSMDIQRLLDATITMALDECTPFPIDKAGAYNSMQLSVRWAKRSREAWVERTGYGVYGIAQGSVFADLREESIKALTPMDFHGIAIGGLAVGEGQDLMFETLDVCEPFLPREKPRYLMGVGKPLDLIGGVKRGVDQFDCVLPTRSGRTGQAFTWRGPINMRNARHQDDPRPIDEDCSCPACRNYSRAYIRHLHRSDEMLGAMLLTWHNIQHYQDLMARMRSAIEAGAFADFEAGVLAGYARGDIDPL